MFKISETASNDRNNSTRLHTQLSKHPVLTLKELIVAYFQRHFQKSYMTNTKYDDIPGAYDINITTKGKTKFFLSLCHKCETASLSRGLCVKAPHGNQKPREIYEKIKCLSCILQRDDGRFVFVICQTHPGQSELQTVQRQSDACTSLLVS